MTAASLFTVVFWSLGWLWLGCLMAVALLELAPCENRRHYTTTAFFNALAFFLPAIGMWWFS